MPLLRVLRQPYIALLGLHSLNTVDYYCKQCLCHHHLKQPGKVEAWLNLVSQDLCLRDLCCGCLSVFVASAHAQQPPFPHSQRRSNLPQLHLSVLPAPAQQDDYTHAWCGS